MKCDRCGKETGKDRLYKYQGRLLCEDCRIHVGLYPLGHTGSYGKAFNIKDRRQSG